MGAALLKTKKRSLLLLIACLFWLSYITFTGVQYVKEISSFTEHQIEDRQVRMLYVQDQAFSSLVDEKMDLLKDQLENARKISLIDFYILQKENEVVMWYNNFNDLEGINVEYKVFDKLLTTDTVAFRTLKAFNYTLTLGLIQNKYDLIKTNLWLLRYNIARDILFVTASLIGILFFMLKDILSLSKVLTGKNRNQMEGIKARSAEAEALINASKGLEGERQRLSVLSETYSQTVGPAIVHEIQSGRPAPYQFQATICRIDLNGYTQLMLEKEPSYLNNILNSYFAMARETINRYGGLIYQFVGDEIVFEFKDDLSEAGNSIALATACIRDLFQQARILEDSLPADANHYFKLKAAFARGTMRFVALDQGHALSGIPLVESVRLLSTVEDKSNQILTFFEEDFVMNQDLVFIFDRKENQLKGFKESSRICCSRDFRSIDWLFDNQSWSLLKYYRSDADLTFILKKIRLYAGSSEGRTLDALFEHLKSHHFTDVSTELAREAQVNLFSFMELEKNNLLSEKALASYISFYQRIVPIHQRGSEAEKLLHKLLSHKNFRVQANTVLAIGPSLRSAQELKKRIHSSNNRLAAHDNDELAKIHMDNSVLKA